MSREIKFRAWDKRAKKWRFITSLDWYRPDTRKSDICGVIVVLDDGRDQFFPIEEVEVVEFTGLRDKNGKEIYEHDILRFPASVTLAPQEVLYSNHLLRTRNAKGWWGDPKFWSGVEVIGNIYENPELLK